MANLLNCDILFTNGSGVFIYDFTSNVATNVSGSILNLNTSLPYVGITHSLETIFLLDSSTNTYLEFFINGQKPFSAEYIRTLYPNSFVDNWFAVPVKNPNLVLRPPTTSKAPNLLVSISGDSVIEWIFSSKSLQETFIDGRTIVPTYLNVKFNVTNGNGIKDISFSRRENKLICTYGNAVKVYDYESGALLSTVSSPTITNIVGYFSNNFIPYVITQNGQIYEVNFNLNTFTLVKTIPSFGGNIVSISQTKECTTVTNTSNIVTNNTIGSTLPPIAPQTVDRFITVNNYTPVNPAKSDFNLGGTKLMDPNFSLLGNGTFTLLTTDSVWKNKQVGSSYQSPLLRSLVWRDRVTAPTATEFDGWAGYSVIINVPTTKTYYIGCGGGVRLWAKANGETIFETNNYYLPGINNDLITEEYVKYWHVYPITLSAGTNVVELLAYTMRFSPTQPFPYFGFEIYDNTYSQLVNATTVSSLNIIFSTTNKVGTYFDVAYSSTKNLLLHGNICDEGYVYNSTLNACVKYDSIVDPVYVQTEVYGSEVDKCLDTFIITGVAGTIFQPSFYVHRYDTNGRVDSNRFIRELQYRTYDDIAHTEEKIWLSSSNFIFEYKIYSLKPFFAAHNRTLKTSPSVFLGQGLASISGNTLIGNVGNTIVEIDVTNLNPIITNKFTYTPTVSTNLLRDITYTPNKKIICTFDDEIIQYDYSTGNVENRKSLANYWSSSPLCVYPVPQGVVHAYNGLNLVNECGFYYVMGTLSGNTFGRIMNGGAFVNGVSKLTECNCIVETTNIVLDSETITPVTPSSYLPAVEPTTFNVQNNILDTIVHGEPYVIARESLTIAAYLTTPGIWKNVSGNEGPLKRTIVWSTNQTPPNWGPTEKWIGFNECINIPTTKTYYIGMGGDDSVALYINGELILKFIEGQTNYRNWHIYPIKLNAGVNTFEFLGANRLGVAGFGFELYNNTLAQLMSATNIGQLNIIFSTASKRNSDFNVVRNAFFNYNGYNNQYIIDALGYDYLGKFCPDGYYYQSCSDSCVKFEKNSDCILRTSQNVNCDTIFITAKGNIFSYNYATNTGIDLFPLIAGIPPTFFNDVAHTETKLWLTKDNTVLEFNINSLSPFSATYNRTLTYPGAVVLNGLTAINDSKLITSISGDIIELDIIGSSPIGTTKFSTPPGTTLTDIVFISQDKIICTFLDRIIQYNYSTSSVESVIIPPTVTNIQSVFTDNNNFYAVTYNGDSYFIDPSTGTLSLTQNIAPDIVGSSQISDCLCIPSNNKIIITGDSAIAPRIAIQSVKPNSYDENFTVNGAFLYSPGYNYDGTGNIVATLTQNNLWRNNTGTNGPIDRSIVWTIDQTPYPYSTPWDPTLLWLGFSETISSPTTKTYYIGMAGNDFVALRINGVTVLNLGYNKNALNSGFGWHNWRIYPVVLNAGDNIIEFLGCNLTEDSGFGFEVYDNTATEIISANNLGDLNIIFSTANKQGTYISPGVEYFNVVYNAVELIYNQSYEVGEPNSFLGYRCIDSNFVYDSYDGLCKSFVDSTTGCTALENVFIPPVISINPCDILYTDGGIIYHYDYTSNVTTDISTYISGYILPDSILEIAHTTSKIWVSTGFEIYEYDITSLSPFSGSYSRTIVMPPTSIGLGPGLTHLNGNILIGSSGADIVEIDVTNLTAIINTIFTLPTDKKIVALIYSDSELTCTHFDTTINNYTITQHIYPSGTINFDYTLPTTITYPSGLFTNNNLLYVADVGGEVYEINTSNAFSATFTKNMGYFVAGMSQISGCTPFSFTSSTVSTYPPPCIFSALTVTGCTDLIIIDITTTNIECLIPFGTLTVTITGGCAPYTYTLLDQSLTPVPGQIIISSANTVTFTGLSEGTYFVSVIDCSNPLPVVSTETGIITSDITLFANVFQLNSQQVCVTITGGTPPYNVVLNGTLVSWNSTNQTNCYNIPCEDGNVYYEITDSCQAQYSSVTTSYSEEFVLGNDVVEVIYHLNGDPRIDGTNLYNAILTNDDVIFGFNSSPEPTWLGPGYFNPLRPSIFSCNTLGNYSVVKRYECPDFGFISAANSCISSPPEFTFELGNEVYGKTFSGGLYERGSFFKSDRFGNITFIKNFSSSTQVEGSLVTELILGTNGGLYATLWEGGAYALSLGNTAYGGTVLSCTTQGQQVKVLYNFDGIPNDGYRPGSLYYSKSSLIEYNNKLYGTTGGGGLYGANPPFILGNVGTLFSIGTNGQNYSTIHNFGQGLDGFGQSTTWLSIIGGKIFGTLADSFKNYSSTLGLPGDGLLFSCDTSGSNYEIIRYFRNLNISQTPMTPLQASNGKVYGALWDKQSGGAAPSGAIFKYNLSNRAYNVTHTFGRYVDGYNPRIIGQASDNYVYGICSGGGLNGAPGWGGTIWRFCPEGVVCRKVSASTENILISSGNCCSAITTTELISEEVTVITSTTLSALTIVSSGACLNGIDIVFSIDYTSSMGPNINVIKSNITSIVNTVAALSNNNYRFGLVLFDEFTRAEPYNYMGSSIYTSLPASQKYTVNTMRITALELMSLNNLSTFLNKLNILYTSTFGMGTGGQGPEPSDVALELISPGPTQITPNGPTNFAGAFRANVAKYVITVTDALSSNFDDNNTYSAAEINFANTIANKFNVAGIKHILWRSFDECPIGSPSPPPVGGCYTDPILTLTRNNNGYYVSGFTVDSVNRINQVLSATCASAITYTSASITFSAITGFSTTTILTPITTTSIVGDCCKITGTTQFSCLTPSLVLIDYLDPTCINDGYITVQVSGGTPPYSITATNVTTNQQFVQNNITNIATFTNLLEGTYNIVAVDANGLVTNFLNITLTNSFQIGIIQTIQTTTGTTYCFIVQGSNANTVQVTVDNNLFFTANTGVLTCFDIPIEDCGTTHTIEVVEYIDYEEGALLIANDGIGCDPASQIVKTGTTINGRPSYSFIQNGEAALIYWDTTISPNRWVLKNTSTNTICATLLGSTNPLLINYPVGNTTNWQFTAPTPAGCSCFRGIADFQTGYIIYPGCSDTETFYTPCPDLTLNVISFTNPACNCDGIITIEATGGTTPYTYTLTDNISYTATNSTGVFTNLCEGTYYPSVFDGSLSALTATAAPITLVSTFDVSTEVTNINITSFTATFCVTISGGSGSYTIQIGSPPFASYYPAIPGTYCYDLFAGQCYDIFVYDTIFVDCNYSANTCMPTQLFGCVSNSSTNPTCGSSNGTITVEVSGGSPSYLYTLYNNGNVVTTYTTNSLTHTFSGITGGTYTVTIQDDTGTVVTCFNDTIIDGEFFADIYTQSTCEPIGQYCVIVSGGTPPYTLSNGITTVPLTGDGTYCYSALCGTYNISIQDSSSCQYNESINILCGLQITGTTTLNSCGVVGSGSVTIYTIIGGVSPYEYSFDGGLTYYNIPLIGGYTFSSDIFGSLFPGNYPFIVRDASGCTASTEVTITENPVVNVSAVTTPESCDYDNSGTITIFASGGTLPYQYSINGGGYVTTNYFTGLTVGTYTISVLDANNCEGTTTVTIDPPIVFSGTSTAENCDYSSGGTITISGINGGVPPYQYSVNGGAFTSLNYFTGLTNGTYSITIIDSSGCTATTTTVINPPILIDAVSTSENCLLSSGGTITANASQGVPPYQYSLNGGTFTSSNYFTGLTIGTYSINAIDISGCSATTTVSISAATPIEITAVTTNGSCLSTFGSIFVLANGGTPPYQYSIDNGVTYVTSPYFPDLIPSTYFIIVKDVYGCSASTFTEIINVPVFTVTATTTPENCDYNGAGTLTVNVSGGTPPFQYSINGGSYVLTNYFTGLTVGTYSISVIDGNNCESTTTAVIDPPITLSLSGTPENCDYSSGGTLTINGVLGGSSPYQYSVNGSSFTNSNYFTGLTNGTYTITVLDASGCTATTTTVINPPILISAVTTSEDCFVSSAGTITAIASEGTAPYQYSINGGAYGSSNYFTGLTIGSYLIGAIDISGCSATTTVNISAATPIDINAIVVNESCFNNGSGSILLTPINGVAPYQYSLTGGLNFTNNGLFTGLTIGTYDAVVIDLFGCSASTTVTVSSATPVVVTAVSFSGFSCSGLTPTTLNMTANGGSPPYTYLWQPFNVSSQSIVVNNYLSSAGTYTFTAITYDRFGCSGSTTITFALLPAQLPTLTIYSAGTLYCDGSQYVTLSASVNTSYSQITWSNGQTGVSAISATTPDDYFYVIEVSGCTYSSDTITVDYPVSIPPEIIGSAVLCPCSATTLTLLNNGEVYTNVQWNTLETGSTITVSSCTEGSYDYYVTALDIYGCPVTSNTVTVTYVALDVNIFTLDATCCDCGDGYAEVQILSGFGPFTFDWIGTDSTTNVAENLLPGSYTVNITDSTGCFASYTFDISCQDIAVCIYVPLTDATGQIILNPDGTVSFYNPDDNANARALRITSNVPEECCIETSVDGSPLQFCNGKCYWNTSGCTEDLPDKIIFGIDQNNGITLPSNTTTGVTQSQECQTQVTFDYLFNFDCQSLLQCIQENYSGSVLTFLSGLSASATIEVLQSGTTSTYVTEQIVPIWNFNFYDQPTGVYFNGSGCTTLEELIYNELGSNCTAFTENTFAVIWRTASFKLYDSLAGKTIKLGLLLDGFNCDYNILLDNIKIEQVCIISSDQILSDSDCPGFDLVKIVDNKKSWIYNESLYDRDWFHLKYRDTSYDDYHERLDINTKEVDLEIDPARAIEYDMYCYAQSEPCFLGQDCNYPQLALPFNTPNRRICFPTTSPRTIQFPTLPLLAGETYTIDFSILATGFGGPTTLLLGALNFSGGTQVPLVDNIVVSGNGVSNYTLQITLPTTFTGYTYLYFTATAWVNPTNNRRFCLFGPPNLSVKKFCDPADLSIDDFITVNSATTFNEFIELIENQLIDVKDRQSLSEYATLQYMYERYLGCGNNCATQSNQYSYSSLNTFSNLIGGYWNNLIEQFVPATTIWKGGTRSYRNSTFHQPKYEYRNFQMDYCEECVPTPVISGYCYVTTSDKTLQLTPIGFSTLSTTIANKLSDANIKNLFLGNPGGCVYQNSRDCCVTLDCFVSGTVILDFKEGTKTHSATTTFSSIVAPPSSSTYLSMFYSALTALGYNNQTPYNNFEWSTQDLQNCGVPINIATTLLLTYSCLTSTTVVTTATTGDITYQLRFNNFIPSDGMTPSGRFVISGGTIIYGVVTDLSSTSDGYIYRFNISNSSFNIVKTFNFGVDQIGNPASGLILAPDGYLYGTTLRNNLSGSLNYGALYRINPITNAYQTLKKFTIADGGKCWVGQELVYDGLNNRLYIPLVDGSNCSIYSWNLSTQTGNIFYNFGIPVGNIFLTLDSGSNKLYCATTDGGAFSRGSIFSLNLVGALTPTTRYSFDPSAALPNNVINPSGALVKDTSIANVFYGLTSNSSSSGYMSIYRFDASTNSCNVIYSFSPPHTAFQGLNPQGDLVYRDNYLYGVAVTNGPFNYGTLFRYNITTDVFGTIHLFGAQANDALYSIRAYSNLQYNPTDNFFYGISPLDGGNTVPRNNGQIYRFNFTGGTSTATTNVTGVALYTCEYIGTQSGVSPVTWEKTPFFISGTSFSVSGETCPRYCPPDVEVIVEDYTNIVDPCGEIELIERCDTVFATHIDDDIWFEGTVTVTIDNNGGAVDDGGVIDVG